MHFFTYSLKRGGRIVRRGKGTVEFKDSEAVQSYLSKRYGPLPWDSFEHRWHSTESAAFKADRT